MSEPKPMTDEMNQSTLQEEYLKSLQDLEEGQLIEGTIIEINSEFVFVDVGYKSEGKIPLDEFTTKQEIGETVHVILVKKEGKSGEVIVSKKKADIKLFWKELRHAHSHDEPVPGTFEKAIKGGFEVNIGFNVRGFCPLSKTDIQRVEKPEEYVGMEAQFLIERLYSENKIKIVLSRRNYLEKISEKNRDAFFKNTKVDDEVEGTVKSFTSFGAFVDLDGFDGLLHINDMSWGHVTRPKDFVKKGQKIKLKVIKLDPKEKKINLSLKHFSPDPWTVFEENYNVGDVVKGKVTKLTDFGAFIQLEDGIEGLAHISELSWTKRIKHPKEVLSIGDNIETKILAYDIEQGRVSLGIKQVLANPWDDIDQRYPVGTQISREVKKITNTGAFIEVEEGIDGFLHIDDLSWTRRLKHPSAMIKVAETISCVVIGLDKETHRIRLGIKQLCDDPWETLNATCPKGSIIDGEITSITDFGIFVKVQGGIEGLVNKHHLSFQKQDQDENLLEKFKAGDRVKAVIVEINPKSQKLSLSIKEYQKNIQKEELSKYIHNDKDEGTSTLADFLKDKEKDSAGE
ncbi:MAG: 30S ribosomal protein S1 [Spirochaetales bacterium]|nr:30S ribosomal protein S1 [Spirochaetales bacterium]